MLSTALIFFFNRLEIPISRPAEPREAQNWVCQTFLMRKRFPWLFPYGASDFKMCRSLALGRPFSSLLLYDLSFICRLRIRNGKEA